MKFHSLEKKWKKCSNNIYFYYDECIFGGGGGGGTTHPTLSSWVGNPLIYPHSCCTQGHNCKTIRGDGVREQRVWEYYLAPKLRQSTVDMEGFRVTESAKTVQDNKVMEKWVKKTWIWKDIVRKDQKAHIRGYWSKKDRETKSSNKWKLKTISRTLTPRTNRVFWDLGPILYLNF